MPKEKHQTAPLHIVDETATEILVRCELNFAVTQRTGPSDIDRERDFNRLVEIPPAIYCPAAEDWFIRAPEIVPSDWYVKCPALALPKALNKFESPKSRFFREVLVCETLASHPHLNVARYHGVIARDGLVRGICYEKFACTLDEKVNPEGFEKGEFRYSGKYPLRDRVGFVDGVRLGVKHLHALGLVHNDLKPGNIMLKDDGLETPVIVDFDSCAVEGTDAGEVGRTVGWHDRLVKVVLPTCDVEAVDEIERWLSDDAVADKGYRFGVKEFLTTGERAAMDWGSEVKREGEEKVGPALDEGVKEGVMVEGGITEGEGWKAQERAQEDKKGEQGMEDVRGKGRVRKKKRKQLKRKKPLLSAA